MASEEDVANTEENLNEDDDNEENKEVDKEEQIEEPGNEEPCNDEPCNDEPCNEEPCNEEPGNEEPGNEGPGNEEPCNEEPDNEAFEEDNEELNEDKEVDSEEINEDKDVKNEENIEDNCEAENEVIEDNDDIKNEVIEDDFEVENKVDEKSKKRPSGESSNEPSNEPDIKKQRAGDDDDAELRLLITSKHGRIVIGKGGETIKKLRSDHSLKIIIPDCSGPERLVNIYGKLGSICEMMLELIPIINEGKSEDKNEIRALIHQSQAGPLIGKGGSVISRLREETNAAFKVFELCCPLSSDRIAQISGTTQVICDAISAIINTLEPFPPIGKISPYDPINFDEIYAVQYGGFSNSRPGSSSGRGYNRDSNRRGYSGNNRNDMYVDEYEMYGRNESRYESMNENPRRMNMMRDMYQDMPMRDRSYGDWGMRDDSSYSGRFNARNSGYGMNRDFDRYDLSQVKSITIPGKTAGILLNKGGTLVQKVRDTSGAGVKIINNKDRDAQCQVNITGTPNEIRRAEMLIKQYS